MFISRKEWDVLKKRITDLEHGKVAANYFKENFVECKVCGCRLNKSTAIQGKPEVRVMFNLFTYPISREEIYHPYYCKVHAPKTPKTGGKK